MSRTPSLPDAGPKPRRARAAPRKASPELKPDAAADPDRPTAIRLYDFQKGFRLPLDPVADPAADPVSAPLYGLLRDVLAFYETEFGRRSHDGAGGRVVAFLRYPVGGGLYDPQLEALRFSGPWRYEVGGRILAFGDFAASPDYVAHEFAHAVTAACAQLDYGVPEQAALQESLSDVFAVTFRWWRARREDPDAAMEWRFGAGVAQPPLACTRNLADPADPDAWTQGYRHMSQLRPGACGTIDPYAYAAIASLAFRRVAAALDEDALAAARIWAKALFSAEMAQVRGIADFARLTLASGGAAQAAIRAAWNSVGVLEDAPPAVA